MSEIGEVIDRLATQAIGASLRERGFRKAGRTWRRRAGDAIQVLNVQASRGNAGPRGRFWLNAGVYFPALAVRIGDFPPTDAPQEVDCQLRTRPMPFGKQWWEVRAVGVPTPGEEEVGGVLRSVFSWFDRRADRRAPTQHRAVTAELLQATEANALPWLERLTDLRAAREELIRTAPLRWAAAASLELGETGAAAQLLARAIEQQPDAREELLAWGRRNGLDL